MSEELHVYKMRNGHWVCVRADGRDFHIGTPHSDLTITIDSGDFWAWEYQRGVRGRTPFEALQRGQRALAGMRGARS